MTDFAYTEYETVKLKLKVPDDSLKDELSGYIQDVDVFINNKIRQRIGFVDYNGDDITLPLTASTRPALDEDLKAIASDLVFGKYILKNSEKPLNWETSVKALEDYLDLKFGYIQGDPYRPTPTLTVSPRTGAVGATVTVTGTNWAKYAVIYVYMSGILASTTPTTVTTNGSGDFSCTFVIASTSTVGSTFVKVTDKISGRELRFSVTS